MKKKIMAVTLCLAMVSTFAVGCGQKNETDSGKSEEKSSGKVEIEALWFNIGYTIALVVLLIVIPLTIALALNRIRRLSTLFRSIYFIPAVISMVTVGLIWKRRKRIYF